MFVGSVGSLQLLDGIAEFGGNMFALQSPAKSMVGARGERHTNLIHCCSGIIRDVSFGKKPDIQVFQSSPCRLSPFANAPVGVMHHLRGQAASHDHAIGELTSQAQGLGAFSTDIQGHWSLYPDLTD